MLHKANLSNQGSACTLVRADKPHLLPEFPTHDADGCNQVAIVGNDHCRVVVTLVGVMHHVRGKCHVRALLFGLDDLRHARPGGERHLHDVREKLTEVDLHVGQRCQGPKVDLLPSRLTGVVGQRGDPCSEVPDAVNPIAGKQMATEFREVDPSVGGPFERAVVEVEAVNVNVRRQRSLPETLKARLASGLQHPSPKLRGGWV